MRTGEIMKPVTEIKLARLIQCNMGDIFRLCDEGVIDTNSILSLDKPITKSKFKIGFYSGHRWVYFYCNLSKKDGDAFFINEDLQHLNSTLVSRLEHYATEKQDAHLVIPDMINLVRTLDYYPITVKREADVPYFLDIVETLEHLQDRCQATVVIETAVDKVTGRTVVEMHTLDFSRIRSGIGFCRMRRIELSITHEGVKFEVIPNTHTHEDISPILLDSSNDTRISQKLPRFHAWIRDLSELILHLHRYQHRDLLITTPNYGHHSSLMPMINVPNQTNIKLTTGISDISDSGKDAPTTTVAKKHIERLHTMITKLVSTADKIKGRPSKTDNRLIFDCNETTLHIEVKYVPKEPEKEETYSHFSGRTKDIRYSNHLECKLSCDTSLLLEQPSKFRVRSHEYRNAIYYSKSYAFSGWRGTESISSDFNDFVALIMVVIRTLNDVSDIDPPGSNVVSRNFSRIGFMVHASYNPSTVHQLTRDDHMLHDYRNDRGIECMNPVRSIEWEDKYEPHGKDDPKISLLDEVHLPPAWNMEVMLGYIKANHDRSLEYV